MQRGTQRQYLWLQYFVAWYSLGVVRASVLPLHRARGSTECKHAQMPQLVLLCLAQLCVHISIHVLLAIPCPIFVGLGSRTVHHRITLIGVQLWATTVS